VHRARRGVDLVLGPLWVTTFRDPVREGRLRLTGGSRLERHVGRAALVALVVLLGSALFATTWRRGELLPIDTGGGQQFVPAGVVGITLLGFALAWLAITWGALRGSAPVRLSGAVAFLLLNATLSVEVSLDLGEHRWILEHGRLVQEIGYWTPVAALAFSALTTRWRRIDRWVVATVRLLCLAGTLAFFLSLLWAHGVLVEVGRDSFVPSVVSGSLTDIGLLLTPLVYISAIAVVDFALDVSSSLAAPASALRRRWAMLLVLTLVAGKLWFSVLARTDFWRATLAHQPQAVVRTVLCTLALGALVVTVTRFRRSEDSLAAKEDLAFGGSLVLTSPYTIQGLVLCAGIVVAAQASQVSAIGWATQFPANWLSTWGMLILSVLAVVIGVVLMRRSRGGIGDELGSGLVLIGAWDAVAGAVTNFGFTFGFSYPTVDVTVTLAVLAAVLLRWRRADNPFLLTAGTVLVFSWLVTSRGDYISFAGGLVGLPTVVVLVFGIVWTLLSGSSFASTGSRWLPQPARPLLFVGYVLLSVAILNWDETTHAATSDSDALAAYYFLGLPLAAWLLGRRVITRAAPASATAEPAAVAAAPTV
jgi:hypothetical protein